MYQLNDTIVAVSSPASRQRVIVRISGPGAIDALQQIFSPLIRREKMVHRGGVAVDRKLRIDAMLYLFPAPHSYTGDDVAEIHIHTNPAVIETLLGSLLGKSLGTPTPFRMAGPGEFTARAYLNGKMDLTQAEAVNEIIVSSNEFQLAASEKLLAGRLAETTAKVRSRLIDCLSLIEAGLDFSGEDIEFITGAEAAATLTQIKKELEQLLSGSISCEEIFDLPAVGIAGAPNAGKSSLLNKLLDMPRSIVSAQSKTTRDVLTGLLTLTHCRCVIFDCAGLMQTPDNILDELAQQAAREALRKATCVVFCIDVSKTDYSEDVAIRELIKPKILITVATKSDLLTENTLAVRVGRLNELFNADFLVTSTMSGTGIELLREAIDRKLVPAAPQGALRGHLPLEHQATSVALTARHRQAVIDAIGNVGESIGELYAGNDEVAAMLLRAAGKSLSTIEQETIDENILERIFSRFCIGK